LATEAGADAFIAWEAARCVARWEGSRAEKGLRRWRGVARSAARQSRRAYIPSVSGPMTTPQVERCVQNGTALLLHEAATDVLSEKHVAQADSLFLVVGPEGGITDGEVEALTTAGAIAVRLGQTILRTSTAAVVALGALGVLTPRWQEPAAHDFLG
jgi:16S rRNA (uracil1498-N3)-methyltransferase